MHPKSPKWLDDIRRSCAFILEHTDGVALDDYLNDRLIRYAVERNLTIIGEAPMRLRRVDPDTAGMISNVHQIIGLRHRLAHGYDEEIDDTIVWKTVRESIPHLHAEAETLLPEFEP
jgi:uncharacterized protein with HEPN domain